jgi:hypothetical protein
VVWQNEGHAILFYEGDARRTPELAKELGAATPPGLALPPGAQAVWQQHAHATPPKTRGLICAA